MNHMYRATWTTRLWSHWATGTPAFVSKGGIEPTLNPNKLHRFASTVDEPTVDLEPSHTPGWFSSIKVLAEAVAALVA